MKVTPSVLVGELHGSAGGTTAAVVLGRQYVRTRVTPKNPKTDAQVAQRALVARMAKWWRSIDADLSALINLAAAPHQLSGYNYMAQAALKALAVPLPPPINGPNPAINALATVTPATGALDGVLLAWSAGSAIATHYVLPYTIPVNPDEVGLTEPDLITFHPTGIVAVSVGETGDLAVDNAAKSYWVGGLVLDLATVLLSTKVSAALCGLATSHA